MIAAFVSIPIVNLATPLFGMALMVHLHKQLSGSRPELIEPTRRGTNRGVALRLQPVIAGLDPAIQAFLQESFY